MVSLDVSLVGFSFAVAAYYSGSVSGEASLEEISRLSFVSFIVFIGDGGGELSTALSMFSFFSSISFSMCLGSLEQELSGRGAPEQETPQFAWFYFSAIPDCQDVIPGDLVSDDLTSVYLETGALEGYVVDAWMILADDPFLRRNTSIHFPSTSGSGFFSIATVRRNRRVFWWTWGIFTGFQGTVFNQVSLMPLHDRQWRSLPSTMTPICQSFDVITSGIE